MGFYHTGHQEPGRLSARKSHKSKFGDCHSDHKAGGRLKEKVEASHFPGSQDYTREHGASDQAKSCNAYSLNSCKSAVVGGEEDGTD